MKTRQAFVANSSSSSFIIISTANNVILSDGYYDEDCVTSRDSISMNIDDLITELKKAKENGETEVFFKHGSTHC